jgi:glutamate racemase
MDIAPRIAVIDSGIGGTGVLAAIREVAPWADLAYVADHAFGPYGERTLDEVRHRTELLARYLDTAGIELVVIACNSASAAALRHLRAVVPNIPFVGMEPAVKPAAEQTRSGVIAVMATAATFQGELFQDLVGRHGSDVSIVTQACPGLAAAVEARADVGPLLDRFLAPVVDAGADVVVLGCTHYPLIRGEIEHRLPDGVEIIDPAPAVARRTVDVARECGVDLLGSGATFWWSTGIARATEEPDDRISGSTWESIDIPEGSSAAIRIGDTTITSVRGDITEMPVDAIVNAANVDLAHGGGVALAIARAGGPTIDEESRAWVMANGPLEVGVAALTSAGRMPASYVIHVAGPKWRDGDDEEERLAAAALAAADMADEIGAVSMAVPAISAGIYGYPPDEATAVIAETIADHAANGATSLRSVRLVGFDEAMVSRFGRALSSLLEPA